mmetsp:Transcript_74028/g.239322  ORF Transcript_74028/g.239322 Transcript_74028/m.239322 type:complete len:268 (-) Transcript_74028:3-806(-)
MAAREGMPRGTNSGAVARSSHGVARDREEDFSAFSAGLEPASACGQCCAPQQSSSQTTRRSRSICASLKANSSCRALIASSRSVTPSLATSSGDPASSSSCSGPASLKSGPIAARPVLPAGNRPQAVVRASCTSSLMSNSKSFSTSQPGVTWARATEPQASSSLESSSCSWNSLGERREEGGASDLERMATGRAAVGLPAGVAPTSASRSWPACSLLFTGPWISAVAPCHFFPLRPFWPAPSMPLGQCSDVFIWRRDKCAPGMHLEA